MKDKHRREDVEMLVPITSRASSAYLAYGDGVPPKLQLGARECPAELLLELANNGDPAGPYLHVERLQAGVVQLHERPHQGSDSSVVLGGKTSRTGVAPPPDGQPGEHVEAGDHFPDDTAAWLINMEDGRTMVLVIQHGSDSFTIADSLTKHLSGNFSVNAIIAGQFTTEPESLVPSGWYIAVKGMDPMPGTAPGMRH